MTIAATADVYDNRGKKLLRAKYIGTDGGKNAPTWLVYGDDLDTCGAIVEVETGRFQANQHGVILGCDFTIRRAIARCLTARELRSFV